MRERVSIGMTRTETETGTGSGTGGCHQRQEKGHGGRGGGGVTLWPAGAGPHHGANVHGMGLGIPSVATHRMTLVTT